MTYTTFSPNISCNSDAIASISKSIFTNKKNNKFMKQLNEIKNNYSGDYSPTNSINVLKDLFNLNKDLIKIVNCKKTEIQDKETESTEKMSILNKINDEISESKQLELQRINKLNVSEHKNKNIEIYYIVYILFIVLLLLIQSSVVIFK
jgi:hypothetical protein